MVMVSRAGWSSVVLLGAIACGRAADPADQSNVNSAGAASTAAGSNAVSAGGGTSGSVGGLGNGGSSVAGAATAPGTGGKDNGPVGSAGNGSVGSAGAPGACIGSDIDIPSIGVSGKIGIGDTSRGDFGAVTLSNGSDVVKLGSTANETYAVHVLPGTYDLIYTGKSNGAHTLKTGIIVPATGSKVLDIEIPRETIIAPKPSDPDTNKVTVAGKFTVDGQPLGTSNAYLYYRMQGTTAWGVVGPVNSNGYSGQIPAGTCDLSLQGSGDQPFASGWLFSNLAYPVVSRGVVVSSTESNQINIDVKTTTVSGSIRFDGGTIPTGCNWGLRSSDVGNFAIKPDATGAYFARVLPGTYELVYGIDKTSLPGSTCPMNTLGTIERGLVVPPNGATIPTIDVTTVVASGRFTLAGAALAGPVPGGTFDDGALSLGTDAGDSIVLGKLSNSTFTTRVSAGTYDLYFDVSNLALTSSIAPLNPHGKIKTVTLAPGAPITLDIDVPSTAISGTVKIGGSLLDKEYDGGRLWLGEPKDKSSIPLTWTSTGKYSARVLPGKYDLFYQGTSPSSLAPFNASAKLGCFQVQ